MASEDLLFHGRHTTSGARILEYPTYHITNIRKGKWNVLCSAYGDSGYMDDRAKCEAWVNRHIKRYVHLEAYLELEEEIRKLKAKLAEYELPEITHTGD